MKIAIWAGSAACMLAAVILISAALAGGRYQGVSVRTSDKASELFVLDRVWGSVYKCNTVGCRTVYPSVEASVGPDGKIKKKTFWDSLYE